jgi:hypothetical protein
MILLSTGEFERTHMTNIIDFNKHFENKKTSKKESVVTEKTEKEFNFKYKFLVDYNSNELYINVTFEKFDINIDVAVNLKILNQLYTNNSLTKLTKKSIKEITGLNDEFVTAIYKAYIEFEFINPLTKLINSPQNIANSYVKKRLEFGYPKNKKEFDRILKFEKEIFKEFIDDTSMFNENLYWKSKKIK